MKKLTKLFSILLAIAVLLVSFPVQTEAATVKLNKTKGPGNDKVCQKFYRLRKLTSGCLGLEEG